jgi:hypothetical protein
MVEKVIPGTSRAAINFIFRNWWGLIVVSALPMVILFGLGILIFQELGNVFDFLDTIDFESQQATAEVMNKYLRLMPMLFITEIVALFLFAWLFVRIVRFWKNREPNIFIGSKGEFTAAVYTVLYGLGIGALTMLAYIAVVIVAIIAGLIIVVLGKLFFVFYFLFVPLAIGAYFSLIWFVCRFYVGMPAVALGETPDFFTELWVLSSGESFAVPLRLIVSLIIVCVPFGVIFFVFMVPPMSALRDAIMSSPNHQISPEMLSQLWHGMLWLQILSVISNFLMIAYFSIFFAEAHARLRARLG